MRVKIVQLMSHNNNLYGLDDAGGLWLWVESLDSSSKGYWKQIAGGVERG